MSDPLTHLLKRAREAHKVSQEKVDDCMGQSLGTYRHIERGRRNPPDFRNGLVAWVRTFLNCVGATRAEREQILREMSHDILEQFSNMLHDIERSE